MVKGGEKKKKEKLKKKRKIDSRPLTSTPAA